VPAIPLRAYATRSVHAFFYSRRLNDILQDDFDLVHAWEEPFVLAGAQIARATPVRTKFVFRTAQSLPKAYPPPFSWCERYCVARADGWICSGRTVEDNLLKRSGYAAKPWVRVPLGVDVDNFKPDAAAGAATRRQLGWTPDGPQVVGYLGRFVPQKGIPMLMRALDRLGTDWRALFVGGGPLETELRAWAGRCGDRVRVVTGLPHENVPTYLNAMDVLAAPSQTTAQWLDQFGRILIEAFASGVPVVGSDSGEIPYVIGPDDVIVPEADEDAWTSALGKLLANPGLRSDFAARGRARSFDYSWDVVGTKYLDFFDRVVDSGSA